MAARMTPVPLPFTLPSPIGRRPTAHLVGIGGAGMKALAELLVGLGWKISGSDQRASGVLDRMRQQGWRVVTGHDHAWLPASIDLLIYSSAVGPENPEREEAARRGVPQLSLAEMLGALMASRVGIAVAGTHGKSTTTAMIATLLRVAGRAPSAAFGAELCDSHRSGWAGEGELLVVEACEYRQNFLALRPTHGVILNVEPDHFDFFTNFDAIKQAFAAFASRLPDEGVLAVHRDCPAAVETSASALARVVTFSREPTADYWAADLRPMEGGTRFRAFCRGEYLTEMVLRIPGEHNVMNALGAIALCHELGVSASDLREGLWAFRGVRRRFETVGNWRGRLLIDDYAHHPTAVRAALETARRHYPGRRICCAFQPHQISRTRALLPEFAAALAAADEVLVVPAYAAREDNAAPITSSQETHNRQSTRERIADELTHAIVAAGASAHFLASLDLLAEAVDHVTRPGDVLVTMGAGDIDRVHHEFSRRLRRHYAAG